ncbi:MULTISPECIES: ATP-binding cassette domain-containing protein [Micromonospora]|uniref:Peptide/nickel transport system ATP-binding protein n=1 Tax=Micromonospora yangpuensis TaxID=683228 RepID=A0A1C6UMJ0_9ACTN|nr:ABC transporter ATP-binding protein [Micromonospora yangpuensis]GGM27950.1 ABC transporter ATP-binding protein [Micromonospora yangpuensis]SCL55254.1 peptide/nickel transport system ATP-binding protein [Micromonospora yangpuensis]
MSEAVQTGMPGGDARHPRHPATDPPVLVVDNLVVDHRDRGTGEVFRAVDHVSLRIDAGASVAVVGESGSGKTTLAMAATGLGVRGDGDIRLLGHSLSAIGRTQLRRLRPEVQVVFQDPHGSLDPRQSVRSGLRELRSLQPQRTAWTDDTDLLGRVRLTPEILDRYPHQLSGGQAQRVCIARALLMRPRLIVADEPTSGLDVSVQADVLALLRQIRSSTGAALLMISHDLAVVRSLCDVVHVMYRGRVVEAGPCETVLVAPEHEYTRELLAAMPGARWRSRR